MRNDVTFIIRRFSAPGLDDWQHSRRAAFTARAFVSFRTLRADHSRVAFFALQADFAARTNLASLANLTSRALRAVPTSFALLALQADLASRTYTTSPTNVTWQSLRSFRAFGASLALLTRRAAFANWALWTHWPNLALRSRRPRHALYSAKTLWAFHALRAFLATLTTRPNGSDLTTFATRPNNRTASHSGFAARSRRTDYRFARFALVALRPNYGIPGSADESALTGRTSRTSRTN